MLKSNLLDGGSTNIRLSSSAYDILVVDCFRFGFGKRDKINISYILSRLIVELTEYRNDLHETLLKNNNGNIKVVMNIENNIFNIYEKTLNYICDDSYINVGYRISKEFMSSLKNVFYETLEKFNMDFSSYVRSIVYEYCSRADSQRELFLNYRLVKTIKLAIKKESVVEVINEGIQNEMIFVSIEHIKEGFNYVVGLTSDRTMCLFLPLCNMEKIIITKDKMHINEEDFNKIIEKYNKFIEEIS